MRKMMKPFKGKKTRYADGGDVMFGGVLNRKEETPRSSLADLIPNVDLSVKETMSAPAKKQSFAEAFRAAMAKKKAGGSDTFTWNGKSYKAEMAGGAPKKSAPAKPAAKPASRKSDDAKLDALLDAEEKAKMFKGRSATPPSKLARKPEEKPKMRSTRAGMKAYAKGGSVSSRADGIAKKGRTHTKMPKMAKGGSCGMMKGGSAKKGK